MTLFSTFKKNHHRNRQRQAPVTCPILLLSKIIWVSLVLIVTFGVCTSVCWAGCWKTDRHQKVKVWFDHCAATSDGECPDKCVNFEWTGGQFDSYAHGSGIISIYRGSKLTTKKKTTIYFGAYLKDSIKKLPNGDEYIGETRQGFFNGQGVYLKKNGEKYLGWFKNSKPTGLLSYYIDDAIKYHGQWKNGLKSGPGIYYEKDKIIKGAWKDDQLDGNAAIQLSDGTRIETRFQNGVPENRAKITYSCGEFYEGEVSADYSKNGYGVYHYKDGSIYKGQWINDRQSGEGKYLEQGKDSKTGRWEDGRLYDSTQTTTIYKNGEKYIGEIKDGQRDGYGTYYYSDGSVYEGDWESGQKNGIGRYKLIDGRYYVGEWEKDIRHGDGKFSFIDGSTYDGEWGNDKQTGSGDLFFSDGSFYSGNWENGKITGTGSLTLSDGASYSGNWANSQKNGKGVFEWPDGSFYDGDWQDDVPDGAGTYVWPNGDQYEGEVKQGYVDGTGIFFYANGDNYKGSFSQGQKSGYGQYFYANGNSYEGSFEDGQPNGAGIFYFSNGTRYEGEFLAGKFYGDGSLYIKVEDNYVVYTGTWDGTNTLPRFASVLFENGDLFEGETDENGRPTEKGQWSTLAERQADISVTQDKDFLRRANSFYKKHQASIDKAVLVGNAALTVLSVIPFTAPVACPALVCLNVVDASLATASQSFSIYDAKMAGDDEQVIELTTGLAIDVGLNAAFILAPKVLAKPAKAAAKAIATPTKAAVQGMRPVAKQLIKPGKRFWKRVSVKKANATKTVKTLEDPTPSSMAFMRTSAEPPTKSKNVYQKKANMDNDKRRSKDKAKKIKGGGAEDQFFDKSNKIALIKRGEIVYEESTFQKGYAGIRGRKPTPDGVSVNYQRKIKTYYEDKRPSEWTNSSWLSHPKDKMGVIRDPIEKERAAAIQAFNDKKISRAEADARVIIAEHDDHFAKRGPRWNDPQGVPSEGFKDELCIRVPETVGDQQRIDAFEKQLKASGRNPEVVRENGSVLIRYDVKM